MRRNAPPSATLTHSNQGDSPIPNNHGEAVPLPASHADVHSEGPNAQPKRTTTTTSGGGGRPGLGSSGHSKNLAPASERQFGSPARPSNPDKLPYNRQFAIYDVKGAKPQIRNIFDACERGEQRAIMGFAKGKDFDIDAKDRYGRTALIWAADCGHFHICESLIRLNANVHTVDSHTGRTALHWAARAGSLPILRLLVQYGANVNKEDRFGLTPLYLAKSRGMDGEEAFQYLLAEGAAYNELKTFRLSIIEDQIRAEMAAIDDAAKEQQPQTQTGPSPGPH